MENVGAFILVLAVCALILIVCWVVLPFAVIGTKPLLRQILAETKRTNDILEQRQQRDRPPVAQRSE